MNAYELADALDNQQTIASLTTLRKIATILRQQADRIEELEKECNRLSDHASELRKLHADRIAELEKDGKVCATCGGLVYDPVLKQPSKQLSDEEIIKIFTKTWDEGGNANGVFIRFAGAIIKEINT